MKKQSPRSRARSTSPARHQFDHVVPTVIHDPEEKMTALGRWTHRVLRNPKRYLGWAAAIAAGVFVLVAVWNLSTAGRSNTPEVWAKLESAKGKQERVDLAKEYPNSPVSSWALLQAAKEYYVDGLMDLPNNRDVALPSLKKALDLFDQVEKEAPKDSPQARAAALGKARTLEARNELTKAIEQYQFVAKNWPDTPEADQARQFAQALQKPEAAAFYKDLYAYSPSKMTLPDVNLAPGGTERLRGPSLGGFAPPAIPGGTSRPDSFLNLPLELAPPSLPEIKTETSKTKGDSKSVEPPAKATSSQPLPDLPADVFSPKPGPERSTSKEKSPR
jgi:tetratricopeptide (TPR) repeat protein